MTTMTAPIAAPLPYALRERPFGMICILGVATLAVGAGAVGAWMAGTPTLVRVVITAAAALTALIAWIFTTLTLRVDADGLYVTWGGVFFKRLRPDEISHAEAGPYTWIRFGGWGWRFGLGGDQAFSYPGNNGALIVHRRNGRRLVVTLRDPSAAAAAVNALAKAAPAAAR